MTDRVVNGRARAIQILDEGLDAARVFEDVLLLVALVDEFNAHAGIEEGQFTQALGQQFVTELDVREDRIARFEANRRAAFGRLADHGKWRLGFAEFEFQRVQPAVPAHAEVQIFGQRVDDRDADAVQAARDLVRAVVEFSAGVQHRHDDFRCRTPFLGVNVDGNAPSVVRYGYRLIRVNRYDDAVAVPRQSLVDRVIHNLENHVVQAGAVIGVADVHAGPFPHCIKTL